MHPMLPDEFFYDCKHIGDAEGGYMYPYVVESDDVELRFSRGDHRDADKVVMSRSEARRLSTDILCITEPRKHRKWIEDINKANNECRGVPQTHVMTRWLNFDPEHPPVDGWYLVCYYDTVDERNEMSFAYWNSYSQFGPEWLITWLGEVREGKVLKYTNFDAITMALSESK